MQLRRLKPCTLQIASKVKQKNGTFIDTYENKEDYKGILQELNDEVSANVYGANINKTFRLSTPYNKLENYLSTKLNNSEDNISKYYLLIDSKRYKVISVKSKWVDIELI